MDQGQKFAYWLDVAEYDLKTADAFPMDVNIEKVNEIVGKYLSDVQKHVKVNKAVLYGSYAKGNYTNYSDVDLAIFSENFVNKNSIEINTFLFSLARKYKEVCIEPMGFYYSDLSPVIRLSKRSWQPAKTLIFPNNNQKPGHS